MMTSEIEVEIEDQGEADKPMGSQQFALWDRISQSMLGEVSEGS